jgi:predicted SprT family Zn-dependent metalloprotease
MARIVMNAVQMNLLFSHSKDILSSYLEKETGKAVSLTITDNSTSMISVKTKGNLISIRLHRMFLDAGNGVIREIAAFVKRRKSGTPLIRDFIRKNQTFLENKNGSCRKVAFRTRGKCHDLQELFGLVNDKYFGGRIRASISWGKKIPRWAVRKRTLGSYSHQTNTIWINPVLDRKNIPRYLVKFIVYHEMLHCDIPVEKKKGRRLVHSTEFKRRERLFEHYEKVLSWEKRQ